MKEPLYPVEIKDIDLSKLDFLGEEYFAINKNNSRVTIYSEEDIEGMLITHIYLPSPSTPLKQLSDEETEPFPPLISAIVPELNDEHKIKLDLKTLEFVKFSFDIHSDHSTACHGYKSLCRMIEHPNVSQSDHINPIELLEEIKILKTHNKELENALDQLGEKLKIYEQD